MKVKHVCTNVPWVEGGENVERFLGPKKVGLEPLVLYKAGK